MATPRQNSARVTSDRLRGVGAILCAIALAVFLSHVGHLYLEVLRAPGRIPWVACIVMLFSPPGLVWMFAATWRRDIADDRELAWIVAAVGSLTALALAVLGSPGADEVMFAIFALVGVSAVGVMVVHTIQRKVRRAIAESNREGSEAEPQQHLAPIAWKQAFPLRARSVGVGLCGIGLLYVLIALGEDYGRLFSPPQPRHFWVYALLLAGPLGLCWLAWLLPTPARLSRRRLPGVLAASAIVCVCIWALLLSTVGHPKDELFLPLTILFAGFGAFNVLGVLTIVDRIRRSLAESNRDDDEEEDTLAPRA